MYSDEINTNITSEDLQDGSEPTSGNLSENTSGTTNDKKSDKKPHLVSRIKGFFKAKFGSAAEFMKKGRAFAMIMEIILGAYFSAWIIEGYTHGRIPTWGCFLIAAAFVIVFSEILNLVLKIIFGAGKRCKSYFFIVAFLVSIPAIGANQMTGFLFAYGVSFLLTLAVDIVARVLWGFIRTRRFKQKFAYIALAISLVYISVYALFFLNDSFGKSRVEFYNQIDSAHAAPQAAGFGDFLKDGPHEVKTLAYGPENNADIVTETLDYTIFDSVQDRGGLSAYISDKFSDYDLSKVPVKGQIWYPADTNNCPVFFIVHGNHDHTVPSYLGYEYLGQYLASNGFVVVSVDENIINCTGEGNDKRAILLLDNMKEIFRQNKLSGSPLKGLMNEDKVAIGGHSRGGEMVATAYMYNSLDKYPEDGNISFDYHFNITSIVAIAPTVDQYRPVNQSVEIKDVNYLLIHGANDHDVSDMMGEKQYNNITFSDESEKFYMKSSVYILGANHGQFNSEWGRYDLEGALNNFLNTANFIDEADQKRIAKAYIRTFLESTLNGNDTYKSLLSDVSKYTSYLPDTVYVTKYYDSSCKALFTFDDTTDINHTEAGAALNCTGMKTWNIDTYSRGDGGESDDHVLACSWEKNGDASKEVSVEATFPAIDISEGAISFEIADMRENTEKYNNSFGYRVELTDGKGNKVSVAEPTLVYPSLAVQLYKQDVITGSYEYKHQLQTVTVRPESFGNSNFDYKNVVAMRITTGGAEEGKMIINSIAYQGVTDKVEKIEN